MRFRICQCQSAQSSAGTFFFSKGRPGSQAENADGSSGLDLDPELAKFTFMNAPAAASRRRLESFTTARILSRRFRALAGVSRPVSLAWLDTRSDQWTVRLGRFAERLGPPDRQEPV